MSVLKHTTRTMQRGIATATASGLDKGFVEMREYVLKPEGIKDFISITQQKIDLRKQLLPFLGMFTCDTGGVLNRVVHFYHYDSFDARDECRRATAANKEWQDEYLTLSRKTVDSQTSSIFLPAAAVMAAANGEPIQNSSLIKEASSPPALYELRQYQLHPGYGSVPKLLQAFEQGVPHKVAADTTGKLVYFGYTDVGTLNQVIELWRYPSAQACIEARQTARKVPQWKDTIGAVTPSVQFFQSSFMQPLAFSPLQ